MSTRFEEITQRALDAFWKFVADQYPNSTTGDLSPPVSFHLTEAAEKAVAEWIDNNTRPTPTKGPWFVDPQSPYSAVCIKPYPGRIVCNADGTDSEANANVRLLAAAPELLAACEGMCGLIYQDKNEVERIDFDQYEQSESVCLNAIAKASGIEADSDRNAT